MFHGTCAWGQTITDGYSLKARCASIQVLNPASGLGCRGYVGAIADVLANGYAIGDFNACLPPGHGRKEQVKTVKAWLDDHRDQLAKKAFVLVARAFAATYPCADN